MVAFARNCCSCCTKYELYEVLLDHGLRRHYKAGGGQTNVGSPKFRNFCRRLLIYPPIDDSSFVLENNLHYDRYSAGLCKGRGSPPPAKVNIRREHSQNKIVSHCIWWYFGPNYACSVGQPSSAFQISREARKPKRLQDQQPMHEQSRLGSRAHARCKACRE